MESNGFKPEKHTHTDGRIRDCIKKKEEERVYICFSEEYAEASGVVLTEC